MSFPKESIAWKSQLALILGIRQRWEDRRKPGCIIHWHLSCANRGYNLCHSSCVVFSRKWAFLTEQSHWDWGTVVLSQQTMWEILHSSGGACENSAPWKAVLSRCRVQQKLLTSIAKPLSSPHLNHQLSHLGTNPSTINGVSKALISSHKLQITYNSVLTHGKTHSEGKNQVTSIDSNPSFNAASSSVPTPSTVII